MGGGMRAESGEWRTAEGGRFAARNGREWRERPFIPFLSPLPIPSHFLRRSRLRRVRRVVSGEDGNGIRSEEI